MVIIAKMGKILGIISTPCSCPCLLLETFFELFACWLLLQNRRMKWKKENKTKLDGPDMDESPESN